MYIPIRCTASGDSFPAALATTLYRLEWKFANCMYADRMEMYTTHYTCIPASGSPGLSASACLRDIL